MKQTIFAQVVSSGGPLLGLAAALVLTSSAGCATQDLSPAPTTAQVTAAEAAVRVAREAGPAEGSAGQHLRMAQKQIAESKERSANGNNRGAGFLLARAQADAELSQVLRRREKAVADAEVIQGHLAETRTATAAPAVAPMAKPAVSESQPTFGATGTTAVPSASNPSANAPVPAPSTSTPTKPVAPDWGRTPPPSSIGPSPTTPTPTAP